MNRPALRALPRIHFLPLPPHYLLLPISPSFLLTSSLPLQVDIVEEEMVEGKIVRKKKAKRVEEASDEAKLMNAVSTEGGREGGREGASVG